MSYAWEEFYGAVRTLAGRGDQRDRLTRAFQYNLHLLTVHDHDFSEKLKLDFQKMVERVTEAESFEDMLQRLLYSNQFLAPSIRRLTISFRVLRSLLISLVLRQSCNRTDTI